MFKALTASAVVAFASAEKETLFSGFQKGLMVANEDKIEALGCEMPELSDKATQLAGGVAMAQNFTGHKKTKKAAVHQSH